MRSVKSLFRIKQLIVSTAIYGFTKNSSTELAALEVIDRLLNQLNKQKIPINFYLDLSKVFDSLCHSILLENLAYYGVQNKAKDLIESYLSNRKQFVQIGEIVSQVKPISMGVPQGSVIGPLLFNIVINDIIKSSSKFSFILYADDTTLNSTLDTFGTNQVDIEKSIIIELQNILKWLDVNKLCLNVSKSKFMFFRWEDGNNLTSNLFTLINNTALLQHTKKYTRHTCILI